MPYAFTRDDRSNDPTLTPTYSDDLLPDMQDTLAALADLETRYRIDRERLDGWSGPEAIKDHLLKQLDERRMQEREPYAHRLAELHRRMMTFTMSGLHEAN